LNLTNPCGGTRYRKTKRITRIETQYWQLSSVVSGYYLYLYLCSDLPATLLRAGEPRHHTLINYWQVVLSITWYNQSCPGTCGLTGEQDTLSACALITRPSNKVIPAELSTNSMAFAKVREHNTLCLLAHPTVPYIFGLDVA
jgi:hypothetical protein